MFACIVHEIGVICPVDGAAATLLVVDEPGCPERMIWCSHAEGVSECPQTCLEGEAPYGEDPWFEAD